MNRTVVEDAAVDEPVPVVAAAAAIAMDDELMDDMGMDGAEPVVSIDDEPMAVTDAGVSDAEDLVMPNIQTEVAEPDLSPDEIADRILAENQQVSDDTEEEFNLEDFDIGEPDSAPPKPGL